MNNKRSETDKKNTLSVISALSNNCREQLRCYPPKEEIGLEQKIKMILKKILGRNIEIDKYFWPNGLLANALEITYKSTQDIRDFNSLVEYLDEWIESGLKINNLDNTINGYSMVFVYKITKNKKYEEALIRIADYLFNHPKDKYGSLPYRTKSSVTNSSKNIYADSMGMICPFLCRYGDVMNNDESIDLAVTQLVNFINFGFDENLKLPYHAYNIEEETKLGIIGWGRAVGWLMIGLVDSLEYIAESHKQYYYLVEAFKKLVDTSLKYQHSDGYFSWQLETREGPIDTSATSMITYAICKGVKLNILDHSYIDNVIKAKEILKGFINEGQVEQCSAECHGLSMYPQKYGVYPWAQAPSTALFAMELD